MPFDLIAFIEKTPGTGLVPIAAALGDNIYKTNLDDIWLKKEATKIIGVFGAACSTGEDYRLRQPTLAIDHQFIKLMAINDIDPSQGHTHLFGRNLPARGDEKMNALLQNATDEEAIVGVMMSTHKITQSMLDQVTPTHILKGEGDTTLVDLTWTLAGITWDQVLPRGLYGVVGVKAGLYPTYTGLARIVIPGNNDWRPGVPCAVMEADHEEYQSITHAPWNMWPLMRGGGKGGVVFDENHMPNFEFLKTSATTIADQNVELLLKKLS